MRKKTVVVCSACEGHTGRTGCYICQGVGYLEVGEFVHIPIGNNAAFSVDQHKINAFINKTMDVFDGQTYNVNDITVGLLLMAMQTFEMSTESYKLTPEKRLELFVNLVREVHERREDSPEIEHYNTVGAQIDE